MARTVQQLAADITSASNEVKDSMYPPTLRFSETNRQRRKEAIARVKAAVQEAVQADQSWALAAFLKREGYGADTFGLRPAVLEHLGNGL